MSTRVTVFVTAWRLDFMIIDNGGGALFWLCPSDFKVTSSTNCHCNVIIKSLINKQMLKQVPFLSTPFDKPVPIIGLCQYAFSGLEVGLDTWISVQLNSHTQQRNSTSCCERTLTVKLIAIFNSSCCRATQEARGFRGFEVSGDWLVAVYTVLK